jgi:hypothetical protein
MYKCVVNEIIRLWNNAPEVSTRKYAFEGFDATFKFGMERLCE